MATETPSAVKTLTSAQATQAGVNGATFGMIASLVMAGFAMIASATYQGTGFLTPLYHIASTIIAPDSLMASMENGMAGETFTLFVGPAVTGILVHLATGAFYGAAFALIARFLNLRDLPLILGGAAWGVIIFALSAFALLPLTAAILGSGDQIANMAEMAGYGTFFTEHVLFGLVLGALLKLRQPA